MTIGPKLELKVAQSLVLTPQLQQAIKLLQMNANDIETWIEEQIEENPFLEKDENGEQFLTDRDGRHINTEIQENEDNQGKEGEEKDSLDMLREEHADQESLDISYENVFDQSTQPLWNKSHQSGTLTNDIEDEAERSLSKHLQIQLGLEVQDEIERAIGAFLIDSLDENGFLPLSIAEVAKQLGSSRKKVNAVLLKLKQFDPPGLFANCLSECLRLQLLDRQLLTPELDILLSDINLLAGGESETLRKRCQLNEKNFEEAIKIIRTLNPRPTSSFDHRPIQTIVPDLLMRENRDEVEENCDIWRVELNNDTLPHVLVNRDYHAEIATNVSLRGDSQAQEFLKERWQTANWLTKALDQRAQTILKVAAEIVKRQRGFFRYGIAKLTPLVLRDIAGTIGMHESTVSRVVNGKYIQTPRGMFELRYFFTKAIPNSIMRTSLSAKAVRHRIRQIIKEETPDATLSDDKIVEKLMEEGIEIARRTVTKYREAMRIGSSVDRRRQQALQTKR